MSSTHINNDFITPGPNFSSNNSILINKNIEIRKNKVGKNESLAKRRWKLLAKALQSPSQLSSHVDKISLRRFSTYTLIESKRLDCNDCVNEEWHEYTARLDENHTYSVIISHPNKSFTPAELSGFNNTGNICIWPSEETLAYYALANPELFQKRSVLELGGGMSCLAGFMIACHLNATYVHLTDGNVTAVENVCRSMKRNKPRNNCRITSSVLKWNRNKPPNDLIPYDVIVCADCLFFDEYRLDLIETIWNHLASNGLALIMAPNRGNTLQEFLIEAKLRGFLVKKMIYYNKRVWDRHVALLENPDYNEDIHYPILLRMTKLSDYIE